MRILFTTTSGMGHFHPLVPLAKAALKAGHEVAFACSQSLCPFVETSGFRAFATEDDTSPDPERTAIMERVMQMPSGASRRFAWTTDVFIGLSARRSLPNLVSLCRRWKPDLIVHEEVEFAGVIAAEALELPHVAIQVVYPFAHQERAEFVAAVAPRLDELRATFGLSSDPEMQTAHRYLYLSFDPPSLLDPNVVMPPATQHLRTEVFDHSSHEVVPEYLEGEVERPLLYATLGTEAPKLPNIFPSVYQTLLEGLHTQKGTVVLTLGRNRDPKDLGEQPAHVHLERYIPQSLLLPHADVIVTHGGHNTILAALKAGLLLVLVPLFADQPANAKRCVELGVGQMIAQADLTPENVQRAVREVLSDKRYRDNAKRIQGGIAALPGLEYGIKRLEGLVKKQRYEATPYVYS
jgi:UDP:flavonoid glycosyltransferase YjiC (YdhE family)